MNEKDEFSCNPRGFIDKFCDICGLPARVIYCVKEENGKMSFKRRCWEHGKESNGTGNDCKDS
jgi:hypothetical protein